ncbi:hypothetical protein LIER_36568 [Lithospermum erythrorhizon]|uniref:Retrotransposon gag domain-containing protein n=1 Tax=Lithospermum erythrorhizon TaxID=34254 RepID=A0AAV3P7V7_LITER
MLGRLANMNKAGARDMRQDEATSPRHSALCNAVAPPVEASVPRRSIIHPGNEPVTGQQSRHDASAPEAIAPKPPTDVVAALQQQVDALSVRVACQVRLGTNTELEALALFSPEIRRTFMLTGMKLPTFTKFTGKPDLEEHLIEFQSHVSFHQPDSRVYSRAFPSSLAGLALKWFN